MSSKASVALYATYMNFSLLTEIVQKNIVEKCGKVLTYSQKLYLCSQFWHGMCQLKTSRTLFDAEFIYHIRL